MGEIKVEEAQYSGGLNRELIDEWAEAVWARCGVFVGENRMWMLQRALEVESKTDEAIDFRDLLHRAEGADQAPIWTRLRHRMLNHETSFFRDPETYREIVERLIPELIDPDVPQAGPLLAWCAGCSTGQEAYSLAIALSTARQGPKFDVVGSDVSEEVLATAREALYSASQLDELPGELRRRLFVAEEDGGFRVGSAIRHRVSFEKMDLLRLEEYPHRKADLILCQNVLIYFRSDYRQRVIDALTQCLAPGGFLVLSASEAPTIVPRGTRRYPNRATAIYRRRYAFEPDTTEATHG